MTRCFNIYSEPSTMHLKMSEISERFNDINPEHPNTRHVMSTCLNIKADSTTLLFSQSFHKCDKYGPRIILFMEALTKTI